MFGMKKIGYSICLGVGTLILAGCTHYSGYVNSTETRVYYAPETIEIYPTPPSLQLRDADRREALRYELFQIPSDHSNEW
jgi:hypothetical protein